MANIKKLTKQELFDLLLNGNELIYSCGYYYIGGKTARVDWVDEFIKQYGKLTVTEGNSFDNFFVAKYLH